MKLQWPFKKHIYNIDGTLYLTRYTLLRLPFLRIRIHHIWTSDDWCLHDHPWHFMSIILKGGYTEVTEGEEKMWFRNRWGPFWLPKEIRIKKYYWPGSVLFRPATFKHRIELSQIDIGNGHSVPIPAWSLLFMIPTKRDWGVWDGYTFYSHTGKDLPKCKE